MSNKLKLTGLRNIEFDGGIENQKDYAITVIASLDEIRQKPSQGEYPEPEQEIFVMKAINIEKVEEVGGHKEIKISKGFSPSQSLRFSILDYLKRTGLDDTEENYEIEMRKIIDYFNKKV